MHFKESTNLRWFFSIRCALQTCPQIELRERKARSNEREARSRASKESESSTCFPCWKSHQWPHFGANLLLFISFIYQLQQTPYERIIRSAVSRTEDWEIFKQPKDITVEKLHFSMGFEAHDNCLFLCVFVSIWEIFLKRAEIQWDWHLKFRLVLRQFCLRGQFLDALLVPARFAF